MKLDQARLLVRNLVGRLVSIDSAFRLPEGILSADEIAALRLLAGLDSKEGEQKVQQGWNASGPRLDTSAFGTSGPAEKELRLCLDFGTALSKAWATGRNVNETIPLVLGRAAGIGDTLAVPSSIFISQPGRIYLGAAAETQHRQELESGERHRFDNLKRLLSDAEIGQELDDVPLDPAIDPTGSGLSKGDLLVLYLAWVTDMALSSLQEVIRKDGWPPGSASSAGSTPTEEDLRLFRCVRRRFAIPCFEHAVDESAGGKARARWAQSMMKRAVLRAQVVADTLHGSWENLTVKKIKALLDEVREVDTSQLEDLLAETPFVREPIAAGASRFEEHIGASSTHETASGVSPRRFLMVVDSGAGTTDFAMFQVFEDYEEDRVRYGLIPSTVRMTRVAGNQVDEALRPLVLQACNIDPATGHPRSEEDFSLIRADLRAQIREIKRDLMTDGSVDISLRPHAQGHLGRSDLERNDEFVQLGERLRETRREIIESLFDAEYLERIRQANERTGKAMPIYVLLTGGS